jgi:hypothetical protein
MDSDHKRHLTFPLRLPLSMRDAAGEIAHKEGISLNHFISLAVTEKITRLEQAALNEHHPHVVPSMPTLVHSPSPLPLKKVSYS